jgi:hypothetical protein
MLGVAQVRSLEVVLVSVLVRIQMPTTMEEYTQVVLFSALVRIQMPTTVDEYTQVVPIYWEGYRLA